VLRSGAGRTRILQFFWRCHRGNLTRLAPLFPMTAAIPAKRGPPGPSDPQYL